MWPAPTYGVISVIARLSLATLACKMEAFISRYVDSEGLDHALAAIIRRAGLILIRCDVFSYTKANTDCQSWVQSVQGGQRS